MIPRAVVAAALLGACASGNAERSGAPVQPAASAPVVQAAPVATPQAPAPAAIPQAPAPAARETPPAPPPPVEPLGDQEAAELYATACTSCHTDGFVRGSRISEKGWNAEMAKMRKWGAPVEEEQAARFAAWLARKYPVAEAAPEDPRMSAADARATAAARPDRGPRGDAAHGKEVYAQSCASCHGAGALGTGGGPSLVENPVLHQRDRFALLVHEGKGRMPGYGDLKPEDVANLLAFLRGLSGATASR
jgi:mono/diheme cytochrome c family protein